MSDQLLVATRKGLFILHHTMRDAWTVGQTEFLGQQVPMAMHDPRDGSTYAAVGTGHFGIKLHRSPDGGRNWSEITAPIYPPKPDNVPDILCPVRKKPIPWSLELIWSLEPGGKDEPGVLWCGTIPGGLFKSEDKGDSWELVRSLWDKPERAQWFGGGYDSPGIHSISVHPDDSQKVAVGVSCGGVWLTDDGGQTWACRADGMRANYMPPEQANNPNIQDPHRLVRCPQEPDHFWVQHHNGIFRSTDGCAKWTELAGVKPSGFGFAVAVHPRDPGTAWFVPAASDEVRVPVGGTVSVTKTTDGGKTFQSLTNGLPQENAYDLVYRHGLDVDTTGELLAMGSTTGSLWVSEDAGENWQTISNHLPPIFAVRFMHR